MLKDEMSVFTSFISFCRTFTYKTVPLKYCSGYLNTFLINIVFCIKLYFNVCCVCLLSGVLYNCRAFEIIISFKTMLIFELLLF